MLYIITTPPDTVLAITDSRRIAEQLSNNYIKEYECIHTEGYSNCHVLFDNDDNVIIVEPNKKHKNV